MPGLAGHLEIVTGMPARVYLFKDGRPFRLSPVDALLPLRVDLFYRERLWRRTADPKTLEITCNEQSHFVLLAGSGAFDLPPGNYRVEAYGTGNPTQPGDPPPAALAEFEVALQAYQSLQSRAR